MIIIALISILVMVAFRTQLENWRVTREKNKGRIKINMTRKNRQVYPV